MLSSVHLAEDTTPASLSYGNGAYRLGRGSDLRRSVVQFCGGPYRLHSDAVGEPLRNSSRAAPSRAKKP